MNHAFSFSPILLAITAGTLTLASVACVRDEAPGKDATTTPDEIVGGKEANPGAWPGTVALYGWGMQICGGALIAKQWVVTAAHCVNPSSPNGDIDNVVIDRHDLTTTTGESITVKRAFRHPAYSRPTHDNDIALLELSSETSAPLAKLIATAQIPELADGSLVTVVGWGNTSESGSSSNVLREVTVPTISTAQCKTFPSYGVVNENQICAGLVSGGMDSCQGDSGGPVYFKVGESYVHVGLTSWGIGCARPNAPGVYTRTSKYLSWIFEATGGAAGEAGAGGDGGTDGGGGGGFTPFEESGSVGEDEQAAFSYDAPAGTYRIDLSGTNDADLYVKRNGAPTLSSYDCRPFQNGSAETCTVSLTSPGKIHVMVHGYGGGTSDFTLRGQKL